jgi:hypothetical protein
VETSILPVDWIFRSHTGGKTKFKDFLLNLKNATNDKIFGMEFTGVLIDYIWDYYSF